MIRSVRDKDRQFSASESHVVTIEALSVKFTNYYMPIVKEGSKAHQDSVERKGTVNTPFYSVQVNIVCPFTAVARSGWVGPNLVRMGVKKDGICQDTTGRRPSTRSIGSAYVQGTH